MVLVHGFTQTGASWAPVAAELAPAHEVVALDLAGHGRHADVRADLWATARLAGAEGGCGTYVGYSLGGRVALHLALAEPTTVTALVVLGATGGIDDEADRAARREADEARAERVETIGTEAFLEEWLAQPLFANVPAEGRGARSADADGLAASLRLAGTGTQEPLWDRLGALAQPVLVLAGERDVKFRVLGERLAGAIGANATFATIPGAGHTAHLEQPRAFLAAVAPWLAAHAR